MPRSIISNGNVYTCNSWVLVKQSYPDRQGENSVVRSDIVNRQYLISLHDASFLSTRASVFQIIPEHWIRGVPVYDVEMPSVHFVAGKMLCVFRVKYELDSLLPEHLHLFPDAEGNRCVRNMMCLYESDDASNLLYCVNIGEFTNIADAGEFVLIGTLDDRLKYTVYHSLSGQHIQTFTLSQDLFTNSWLTVSVYKNCALFQSRDHNKCVKVNLAKRAERQVFVFAQEPPHFVRRVVCYDNKVYFYYWGVLHVVDFDSFQLLFRKFFQDLWERDVTFEIYKEEMFFWERTQTEHWLYTIKLDDLEKTVQLPDKRVVPVDTIYKATGKIFRDAVYFGSIRIDLRAAILEPKSISSLYPNTTTNGYVTPEEENRRKRLRLSVLNVSGGDNKHGYYFDNIWSDGLRYKWPRNETIRTRVPVISLNAELAYRLFVETYDNDTSVYKNIYYKQLLRTVFEDIGFIGLLYNACDAVIYKPAIVEIAHDIKTVRERSEKMKIDIVSRAGTQITRTDFVQIFKQHLSKYMDSR